MNAIFEKTYQGFLGELIAQTYLLAHGVQAARPLADSGNDLIAVRGNLLFAVQVKTNRDGSIDKPEPHKLYHILALVHLPFERNFPIVANARVFLFPQADVVGLSGKVDNYPNALISDDLVLKLWPGTAPRYMIRSDVPSPLGR